MRVIEDSLKKRKYTDPESIRINWDRLIFRSFLVLGTFLFLGFVSYLLWFLLQ